MNILSLDTSTEYCSVALWLDGMLHERSEQVGQKHSQVLMAMVDGLLQEAGITIRQVEGVAFGKGPGSFTGIRIACGVAQGLALGLDVKTVGVCTLEALAEASGKQRVIAALDARMGELYLAAYEKRDAEWHAVIEPCLCSAETAPPLSGTGWHGCGSGFAVSGEALRKHYDLAEVDTMAVPQASAIVRLAARTFARGAAVDAAQALPLYLRDKVALTTAERMK